MKDCSLVISYPKIYTPRNQNMGFVDAIDYKILSEGLIPQYCIDLFGCQPLCRQKYHRPLAKANFPK
jgi:hypothetical protein